MATFLQLLSEKADLIDQAEAALEQSAVSSERSLFRRVLNFLRGFDMSSGKFTNEKSNRDFLVKLDKELSSQFKKTPVVSNLDAFLKNFDRIKGLNTEIYEKKLTSTEFKKLAGIYERTNPIKANIIKQITRGLTNPETVKANVIEPIRNVLFESIVFERTFADTQKHLRDVIISSDTKNSRLLRYTKQIARDALSQYNGALNDRIRTELDLDGFIYTGSLIKTSRQNCNELINGSGAFVQFRLLRPRVYRVSDIPDILNIARKRPGFNPLTTPETFATYRMGFNCRHEVTYVRLVEGLDFITINFNAKTSQKAYEEVKTFEKEIVNSKIEIGGVFDTKGNNLLRKEGQARSISFTDEEFELFTDAIFTHNHPSWQDDPKEEGQSLSIPDVLTAINSRIREMRAITGKKEYVMRFDKIFSIKADKRLLTDRNGNPFSEFVTWVFDRQKRRATKIIEKKYSDGRDSITTESVFGWEAAVKFIRDTVITPIDRSVFTVLSDEVNSNMITTDEAQRQHFKEVWKIFNRKTEGISYLEINR